MSTATVSKLISEPLTQDFEELFREHHQLVYRTAYSITGRAEDAEDVLQTLFLRLLRRETPPDLQKNPKGYLYRAAVNLSLNTIESRQRHVLTDHADCFESQGRAAESAEPLVKTRRFLDALAKLKPGAVEILILRYEHGYTDAEIAKMLGKSRGVIAVTLYRSRARLKKLLRPSTEKES